VITSLRTRYLAVCLLALFHAATYFYVTSDDALISLRYAVHIADGHGAVYNVGGPAVEGYSNPLFTFAAAAAIAAGVAPLIAAKLIGVMSFLLLLAAVSITMRAFDGRGSPLVAPFAWISALFVAASSFVAFWSTAGLETVFHALLVTFAVAITMRETTVARVLLSPLAWIPVAASRPEGAFLAAFAFAAQWALSAFRPGVVLRWATLFGLPIAALVALRFYYYGDVVPNTFHAKVAFGDASTQYGLQQLRAFVRDGGYWLLLPSLYFVFVRARRSGLDSSWLVPAGVVLAQLGFVTVVGGDFMPGYRFVVPVYPLLCVFAAAGLALVGTSSRSLAAAATVLVLLALPYVQREALEHHPLRFWLQKTRPWYSYLGQTDFGGTWLAAHEATGRYIAAHARPGDRLAVTEAGTIPFFADIDTIDLLGLNHRRIAQLWQAAAAEAEESHHDRLGTEQGPGPGEPGTVAYHNYDVPMFALQERPRWIVLDGSFTDRGDFLPRLMTGRTLTESLRFAAYRKVFEAKVYDGRSLGLGADRVNVVFELRGSRRRH